MSYLLHLLTNMLFVICTILWLGATMFSLMFALAMLGVGNIFIGIASFFVTIILISAAVTAFERG